MGSSRWPVRSHSVFIATACAVALVAPSRALAAGSPSPLTGGGAIAPPPPMPSATAQTPPSGSKIPPPPSAQSSGAWLAQVTVSEYWAAPESWFVGALVSAPGLPGKHRIDWLYSAQGVSMNGQGIGLDGRTYHIAHPGFGGWITAGGQASDATRGWSGGTPFWRAGGYWRNPLGAVTFPLQVGGWSAGIGQSYVPLRGVTFAPGPALPVHPYQSIAVDPRVIPLGSRVYIPAYRDDGYGGWFTAEDTGGAIIGRRIDVYRTPPATPGTGGLYLAAQRVFVVRPSS